MIFKNYDLYISIANNNKAKNEMEIYYCEFRQKLIQFFLVPYLKKDSKVLDIGCQYGDMSLPLAPFVDYLVELDLSDRSLEKARNNANLLNIDNAYFIIGDATSLPFDSDSFDVIIFLETIEHLPDVGLSLNEIYRILKPDGLLLIGTPQKLSLFNAGMNLLVSILSSFFRLILIIKTCRGGFFGKLQDHGIEFPQSNEGHNASALVNKTKTGYGHVQKYSRQGLARTLKDHGFRAVKEGGLPISLTRMIKYYFAFPSLAKLYKHLFKPEQSFLLSRFGNQIYFLSRSNKK